MFPSHMEVKFLPQHKWDVALEVCPGVPGHVCQVGYYRWPVEENERVCVQPAVSSRLSSFHSQPGSLFLDFAYWAFSFCSLSAFPNFTLGNSRLWNEVG